MRRGDSAACSRLAPLARVVKSDLTAAGFIEDSVGLTAIATATTEYTAAGTTCQKAATARTETLGDLTAGDVAIRTAAQQAKAIGTHI